MSMFCEGCEWRTEAATLLMSMTEHRPQEPVKTIFKMQFDLLLWHYKFFCIFKLCQKDQSVVKTKTLMYILMMDLVYNPLKIHFKF